MVLDIGRWLVCYGPDRNSEYAAVSTDILRKHGFAVASVDYRVIGTDSLTIEDEVLDVFDAARYRRRMPMRYNLIPRKSLSQVIRRAPILQ